MQRELKALHIENGIYYKDAVLRFDQNKIVKVYGRNLNTPRKRSNASGKSLLFAYLYNILYFQPPMIETRKRGQHRLMFKNNTTVTVFIETADDRYRIVQTHKGLQVFENGVNLQFGRQDDAQEFIRNNVWPMTEPEFRTTAFLSSNMPFHLQRGTDSQRLEFIEHLFGMWLYDEHHQWYKAQIKALKDKRNKLDAYVGTAASIEASIEGLEVPKGDRAQIEARLARTNTEEQALQAFIEKATLYASRRALCEQAESIISVEPKPVTKAVLKELAAKEQHLEDWTTRKSLEREQKDLKASQAELALKVEELQKACDGLDEAELEASIEALSAKLSAAKEHAQALADARASVPEAPNPKPRPTIEALAEYEVENRTLEVKIRLLAQVKGSESDQCFLCGSSLKAHEHDFAAELKKARKRQQWLELAIEWVSAGLKLKELKAKAGALSEDRMVAIRTKIDEQRAALKILRRELPQVSAELKVGADRIKAIASELKPLPSEGPEGLKELRSQVSNYEMAAKQWRAVVRARSDLAEAEVPEDFTTLKALESTIKKKQERQRELRDLCLRMGQRVRQLEKYEASKQALVDQLAEVKTQVEQHQKEVTKLPILESLAAAYGDKGVKVARIEELCQELARHMNNNRSLLYTENVSFSFEVAPNRLGIIATRPKSVPSDVRFLSGSESEKWNQLLVLALADMIPMEKRSNMVLLDEMISGSDEDSEHCFIHSFLPALQAKIPNVFVLHPKPIEIEDSITVTAVKKGSTTTLESEYPALIALVEDEAV